MNINSAFPSNYLRAVDFPDDTIVTIKEVLMESIGQGREAEDKPVLYLQEYDKPLVLNKTNGNAIAGMYGPESDAWAGKKITLYATEVQFGNEMVMSIRVRLKTPTGSSSMHRGQTNSAARSEPPADDTKSAPVAPLSPRIKAWASLVQKLPSMGADGRTKAWKQALAETFPGTSQDKLTDADWAHFKAEIDEKMMEDGILCPI